ncbi:MAG: glucose-6-phosphate isomerase [Gemmatimonadales bacterium]
MTTTLDFSRMMAPRVPSGATETEWAELTARFADVNAAVARDTASGRHGVLELEAQVAEHGRVLAFAGQTRGRYDHVVVLGIGGSALGAVALRSALGDGAQGPRLHVLDNVDPDTIVTLLGRVALERTLFCVISKSGNTVETLAQYACVRSELVRADLDPAHHLAFVTDPESGPLREIASRESIPAFAVPPNVGGRFSVLTPVGTLPAAMAGYDTEALLAGARQMRDRCAVADLARNPAGVFAMLQWRAHQRAGQGIHVMMPYSDALRDVAPWFAQLWAESLGKVDADGLNVGPTPLAARGATDQHSQLQLFMEGPADKTVTFVITRQPRRDVRLGGDVDLPAAVAHLRGRSLVELLHAEQRATAEALASAGRPSITVELASGDAHHLGALFMMLMKSTLNAGVIYRVNPLDQPGVELGKRLAHVALAAGRSEDESESRWRV